MSQGRPGIFKTDQGAQFTGRRFYERLLGDRVLNSIDGKGRMLDKVFIERLWRTVKFEHIYPDGDEAVQALQTGLGKYLKFYNTVCPYQ